MLAHLTAADVMFSVFAGQPTTPPARRRRHRWMLAACIAAAITGWGHSALGFTYADECAPTWPELPVTYYVDESGTEHIFDLAAVEQAFAASFSSWEAPCCSDFRAEYGGRVTTEPGIDTPDHDSVLTFHDDDWPAALGSPEAIAITMFTVDADCEIIDAPIHFNSAHHQFVDGEPTGEDSVDLQSIATHEVGHLLGLGHSEFIEASMFESYVGGITPRTLHDDDVDGVCALYPDDCPCAEDGDCRPGRECEDGFCVDETCADDDDCDDHLLCDAGSCVYPSCTTDGDCGDERICENLRCVDPCPVCRPCTEHADCGHQGYCRNFPHGGRCFISCPPDGQCPGDSECTAVEFGAETFSFCTAADPQHRNDDCPPEYRCRDFDDDFEPCPGLGNSCERDDYACSPANDICLEDGGDTLLCSCTCRTHADCGRHHVCIDVGDDQSACLPRPAPVCEQADDCAPDQQCDDGMCTDVVDGDSSCAAVSTGPASAGWWLALGLLFAVRRRWRRPFVRRRWRRPFGVISFDDPFPRWNRLSA